MADRYISAGIKSKLISLPDVKKGTMEFDINRAIFIIDQNLNIIWKTLQDIRVRIDALSK